MCLLKKCIKTNKKYREYNYMTQSEFFFNTPIYTPLKLDDEIIKNILDEDKEFEGYNPLKKVESTFIISDIIN